MAVKAKLIQSLLKEHFATLGIPASAWTWDERGAKLTMVVSGKPVIISLKAGDITLRDLGFTLGRIQGWLEAGAIST